MPVKVRNIMHIRIPDRVQFSDALQRGAPDTREDSPVHNLDIPRWPHTQAVYIDCSAVLFDDEMYRGDVRKYAADRGQRPAHPLELLEVAAQERHLASSIGRKSIALIAGKACKDHDGSYEHERISELDAERVYLGVRYVVPGGSQRGNQRFAHGYFFDPWPQEYWHLLVDDEAARRKLRQKIVVRQLELP